MNVRRRLRLRLGRYTGEYTVMLALLVIVCIAAVRLFSAEPSAEQQPWLDRALAAVLGLVQCFGLFIGLTFVLAGLEFVKKTVARYRQRRRERETASDGDPKG